MYFENGLESLRDLLETNASYGLSRSLYCFGLLQTTDIPELIELHKGRATRVRLGEPIPFATQGR